MALKNSGIQVWGGRDRRKLLIYHFDDMVVDTGECDPLNSDTSQKKR